MLFSKLAFALSAIGACINLHASEALVRTATRPLLQAVARNSAKLAQQVKQYPELSALIAGTALTAFYMHRQLNAYERRVTRLKKEYAALCKTGDKARRMQKYAQLMRAYAAAEQAHEIDYLTSLELLGNKMVGYDGRRDAVALIASLSAAAGIYGLASYAAAPVIFSLSYHTGKFLHKPALTKEAETFCIQALKESSNIIAASCVTLLLCSLQNWLNERATAAQHVYPTPPCFYDILQVPRYASQAEIREAYKKLALTQHPDRHQDAKDNYEARFKEIQQAYEILSDPAKRSWYDLLGPAHYARLSQQSAAMTDDIAYNPRAGFLPPPGTARQ